MNYFTILQATDLGEGFILLELSHDYGSGPPVRLPIMGALTDYLPGKRVYVEAEILD